MRRPISGLPAEVIPISRIVGLSEARTPGTKKELDALEESIKQGGLHHAIIVRPEDEEDFALLSGKKRFYCAKNLDWKQIKAIIVEPGPSENPSFMNDMVKIIESFQRGEMSSYEIAKTACAMEDKHSLRGSDFAHRMGLSQGYTYNLMRRWRTIPGEIAEAWKNHHPLLNQDQLERYSHMTKQEAIADWQKRLRLKGGEPFMPDGETNGRRKPAPKKPRRASERQIMRLLDAIDESSLTPPVKDLATKILRFVLGIDKGVTGITDYKRLPPAIVTKENKRSAEA